MDVVFVLHIVSSPSSKTADTVHQNAKKYALRHVLTQAQLASMASSLPTTHNALALLVFLLSVTLKLKWPRHIEKPHRKWALWDYGLLYMFLETGKEHTRHSKCHSLHMINWCRLRFQPQKTYYVKQNKIHTSHFWQLTEDPSEPPVLYLQKPGSIWTSVKKPLQRPFNIKI